MVPAGVSMETPSPCGRADIAGDEDEGALDDGGVEAVVGAGGIVDEVVEPHLPVVAEEKVVPILEDDLDGAVGPGRHDVVGEDRRAYGGRLGVAILVDDEDVRRSPR